jgi:glycosyltransferase involved in cell wall biosynthesis
MKITYVTIEDIRSGLFQTQIIDILEEICNKNSNIVYEVLVFNRPWFLFSHLKRLKELKNNSNSRIVIKYFPLLPPLRHALSSYVYSVFVTSWLKIFLTLFISRSSNILHCRSYWPTMSCIGFKKIPIVFDMRSLWPLENISMDLLKANSMCSKYWFELERECLNNAKVSTCVSQGMVSYCANITIVDKLKLIPISVDVNKFKFSESFRRFMRDSLGLSDKLVFVYSGSFGQANINFPALRQLITFLLSSSEQAFILFLTMEKKEKIDDLLKYIPNFEYKYHLVNPSFDSMGNWLSLGDIGIHALPKQLDYQTRLGTKVVEYWANGLPVIVNEFVGAAADYIQNNQLGLVLSDEVLTNNRISEFIKNLDLKERSHQFCFAEKNFSTDTISQLYIESYIECLA